MVWLDDYLEKVMAPHSSTLAWKIPWAEEPGRLQSMGSLRVGHDWATSLSLFTFIIGEGNGNLLHCSCLENPRDGGAWWAAIYGVSQSPTRLKRFSSSSRWLIGWTLSYSLLWLAESESLLGADKLSPSLYISLIGWTLAYVLPWLADSYLVFFSDWLIPIR